MERITIIKATARENLLGKYKAIIPATILIYLLSWLLSSFFTPMLSRPGMFQYVIYYLAAFIITMLTYLFYAGISLMHLRAGRDSEVTMTDMTYPLKNSTNQFLIVAAVFAVITYIQEIPTLFLVNQLQRLINGGQVSFSTLFFTSILTIVIMIVGIVLLLAFSMSFFLLLDNPTMTTKEALIRSCHYMKGNKLRLFLLYLSFIGLMILGLFTVMIAYLWIIPYMWQATTVFYEKLIQYRQ